MTRRPSRYPLQLWRWAVRFSARCWLSLMRATIRQKGLVAVGLALLLAMTSLAAAAPALATGGRGAGELSEPMPKQVRLGPLAQDTPEQPGDTPEPSLSATPTEEPEPPGETVEPPPEATEPATAVPPDGTVEPTPTGTAEPPPETVEPAPSDSPEPGTGTPGLEPTGQPSPEPEGTEQPATTASATVTASSTASATPRPTVQPTPWGESWPLGTIRIGAEEVEQVREPVQISLEEALGLALALIAAIVVGVLGRGPLYHVLRWIIARLKLKVGEPLLLQLRPLLPWWLAALVFQASVLWVDLQNAAARAMANNAIRLVYLVVATLTVWQLTDAAIDLYTRRIAAEGQVAAIERLRPVLRRWARILILLFSSLVGLSIVQIGFSVPALLVLLIAMTVGIAARDTLADIIAGFSILLDEPFRIGDRIEVQGVEGWVTVINIGLRSSVLRTRHSVEIIMPNSTISRNQVINYSYPDNRYRMQTHVGIAFGTDVERARQVLIDAVRQVQGVLADKPVEALYVEVGDSDMIFRVRWWIDFRRDWERSYDRVHTALHKALKEAGIESPYPRQDLMLEVDDRSLASASEAWRAGQDQSS
jgi:small-conductance mechanosensitive channel/outer membrane biosynthesis protein TonB